MVLCIIGLVVFGILGIFSAKYRILAKEAFECVWNMARFKPCQGTLEDRIRREILSNAFRIHPNIAKYINRYFGILSWLFVALFFLSLFFTGQGIYNYAVYGNCNGPQGGFCIFDPLGNGQAHGGNECIINNPNGGILTPPSDLGNHILGPASAKVAFIEIGCYTCPYTKQAEPNVVAILKKYEGKIRFVFKPFPLPSHAFSNESSEATECAAEQGKFWEYRKALLDGQDKVRGGGLNELYNLAVNLGMDKQKLQTCMESGKYKTAIEKAFNEGVAGGVYGTPTFFINDAPIVGPSSVEEISKLIDAELAK
ncbi:MAG: thioredoxin domain-containing protein [Candidatus Micrarchaeota archaeon]